MGLIWSVVISILPIANTFLNSHQFFANSNSQTQEIHGNNFIAQQGQVNILNYSNLPTPYENTQKERWANAWSPIENFVTRFNRNDFAGSRLLLDKFLVKDKNFTEEKLQKFKEKVVETNLTILYKENDDAVVDDSDYISKRGFTFTLRYIDKRTGKEIKEKWRATAIIYYHEDNTWKIGQLFCVDKACDANYLLQ